MYDARRTVSVSGEGRVHVLPDMAIVHFGVVSVAEDPVQAREQNAEASSRALNALRDLGIEERYIRMESLRLQPHREWVDEPGRYVESGYEAIRTVIVEVHDLDELPTVVARVVEEGANRLEQVTYDLDDRDPARNEALQSAVNSAREKAALVAGTLDEQLGQVIRIVEQSYDFPRPMVNLRMDMAESREVGAPDPDAYAPGEIEVVVNIQATFVLQ